MPTPPFDVDPREPGAAARGGCGYRWTNGTPCHTGSHHPCARTSPDHRTHMCPCEALELRTATHVPLGGTAAAAALSPTPSHSPTGPDLTSFTHPQL